MLKKDYDIYSRVYRNTAYYPLQKGLTISELQAFVMEIIEDYSETICLLWKLEIIAMDLN